MFRNYDKKYLLIALTLSTGFSSMPFLYVGCCCVFLSSYVSTYSDYINPQVFYWERHSILKYGKKREVHRLPWRDFVFPYMVSCSCEKERQQAKLANLFNCELLIKWLIRVITGIKVLLNLPYINYHEVLYCCVKFQKIKWQLLKIYDKCIIQ